MGGAGLEAFGEVRAVGVRHDRVAVQPQRRPAHHAFVPLRREVVPATARRGQRGHGRGAARARAQEGGALLVALVPAPLGREPEAGYRALARARAAVPRVGRRGGVCCEAGGRLREQRARGSVEKLREPARKVPARRAGGGRIVSCVNTDSARIGIAERNAHGVGGDQSTRSRLTLQSCAPSGSSSMQFSYSLLCRVAIRAALSAPPPLPPPPPAPAPRGAPGAAAPPLPAFTCGSRAARCQVPCSGRPPLPAARRPAPRACARGGAPRAAR